MKLITLVFAGVLAASPALAARGGHGWHGWHGWQGWHGWNGWHEKGHGGGNPHYSAPLPLAGGLPAAMLIGGAVLLFARARKP